MAAMLETTCCKTRSKGNLSGVFLFGSLRLVLGWDGEVPREICSCTLDDFASQYVASFSSNKCHASSNKCLTSSNKKLVVTSATLVVTGALLVVTRSY